MLSKTKIKLFSLIFITIFCISSIVTNKGFYYSDLHNSINVKFGNQETGTGFEIEKLDTAEGLGNTARVDKDNLIITYQHESIEEITQKLGEKFAITDFYVIDVSEKIEQDDYINNLIYVSISLLISSLLSILYLRYRKGFTNKSMKFMVNSYLVHVLMLFISGFLTFGILSALSRVYMLTVTDSYSPILSMALLTLIFNYVILTNTKDDVIALLNRLIDTSNHLLKLLGFLLIMLISIIIGMGSNYIYPGIIIILAIIIPILTLQLVTPILLLRKLPESAKTTTIVENKAISKTSTGKKIIRKPGNKKQNKGRK